MAEYGISGIWKDTDGVITHYGFHTKTENSFTRVSKITKAQAIGLLGAGNSAITWVWSYTKSNWTNGEKVEVVGSGSNQYLRTNPDSRVTDNLAHLINLDWMFA